MYWRYLRLRITCTSPTSLPSTLRFFVVSNVQKPIVLSISISSADLPSKSASVRRGRSVRDVRRRDDVEAELDAPRPYERDLYEKGKDSKY